MDIIEGYKRKARESVANVLSSLQQTDHEGAAQQSQAVKKQLIQELEAPPSSESNYQQDQFQFFADREKAKPKQSKCVVCKKVSPKYTCPKCRVRYCSTAHYKTHNLFCTQRFYKGEVEAVMKRTRAAGEERRKMVEMLRVHGEEQGESEAQLMGETRVEEVGEERLREIMAALEEGRDVDLTENEMKCFERYLKEIQECSFQQAGPKVENVGGQDEVQELFEEYVPFWTIEQGLDQYFLINEPIPIEEFNKSPHKSLIQYRQQASPLLRKQLTALNQHLSFKKTSIFVTYDLVQVIYLTSLLFRAFNGQYLTSPDLVECFLSIYQHDLARKVAESHPTKLTELVHNALPTVMPFLRTKMADVESSLLEVLRTWLPFVVDDSAKIFKNRYVCMEALYRLLGMFRAEPFLNKSKGMNSQFTVMKKLQFLLAFTSEIVYSSPENIEKLPQAFIQTNVMNLIQGILSRDKQAEQSQAAALKAVRDQQSHKQQLKLQSILIP